MTVDRTAYEEESARIAGRPKGGGGGGGDFQWLDVNKPAAVGAVADTPIRIVSRQVWLNGQPTGQVHRHFWIRLEQHRVKVDGVEKNFLCPDDHDRPDYRKNFAQIATCPLCILQEELYKSKRKEWDDLKRGLRSKSRCFANVIDLANPASHWQPDEKNPGQFLIRPKVYGYSFTLHGRLIDVGKLKGPSEDLEIGRDLIIRCERIGARKEDIRYNVVDMDPRSLPPELLPVAQYAWDLEALGKPTSLDELRQVAAAVDPRVGRPGGGGHAAPPSGYTPGYAAPSYGQPPGGPPQPPTYAPPQAPAPSSTIYTINGPRGQLADQSAAMVAVILRHEPQGTIQVWAPGMQGWAPAESVPEIAAHLTPPAPVAPPAPPQAPPPPAYGQPPGPPQSYQPRGGYALPPAGPPQAPPPAAPPAYGAPPPAYGAPPGPPAAPGGWGQPPGPPQAPAGYGAPPPAGYPPPPPSGPPQGYGAPPPPAPAGYGAPPPQGYPPPPGAPPGGGGYPPPPPGGRAF